jgi:hypothetical protein
MSMENSLETATMEPALVASVQVGASVQLMLQGDVEQQMVPLVRSKTVDDLSASTDAVDEYVPERLQEPEGEVSTMLVMFTVSQLPFVITNVD